jgi:uncharacterized protein
MNGMNYATVGGRGLNLRFAEVGSDGQPIGDDQKMTFTGYGSVFNNLDSYRTTFKPGAFQRSLAEARSTGMWPAMLLQHGSLFGGDDDMPVGIWTELEEDTYGLRVMGKLADTQRGLDTYKLLSMTPRPAITGLSIGFIPRKWDNGTKPNEPVRSFTDVDLMEVSIVTSPANDRAQIDGVRSHAERAKIYERALREVGLSRAEAKAVLSGGLRALSPRDVGDELRDLLAAAKAVNSAA